MEVIIRKGLDCGKTYRISRIVTNIDEDTVEELVVCDAPHIIVKDDNGKVLVAILFEKEQQIESNTNRK